MVECDKANEICNFLFIYIQKQFFYLIEKQVLSII